MRIEKKRTSLSLSPFAGCKMLVDSKVIFIQISSDHFAPISFQSPITHPTDNSSSFSRLYAYGCCQCNLLRLGFSARLFLHPRRFRPLTRPASDRIHCLLLLARIFIGQCLFFFSVGVQCSDIIIKLHDDWHCLCTEYGFVCVVCAWKGVT